MQIISISPNCFRVREMSEDGAALETMLQGMRDRGVQVHVTKDEGFLKEICIH